MFVRKYLPGEELELWKLFFNTIRTVNSRDYTAEQVQAWAPDQVDEERWCRRIEGINPYVCVHDDMIVGYADLQASGYIDHFYVHHQWQSRGVGRQLFETIEAEAKSRQLRELTVEASITARPFFESHGFRIIAPQEVTLGSVALKNFRMAKQLDEATHNPGEPDGHGTQ
jgi:putative acetyltransferase